MNSINLYLCYLCLGLSVSMISCHSSDKIEEKWINLFDGESLNGWKAVMGAADFEIENGEIIGIAKFGTPNTFLITEELYDDFILEFDLKINHISSNSGAMVRGQFDPAARNGNGLVYGYQIEADPTDRAWSGGLYDEARRGWIYPMDLNPPAKSAFKMGEWNTYRIEAIGNEIKSWINGQEVAYVVDDMDSKGFIGLQVHSINDPNFEGEKTHFRNIRIQTEDLTSTPFNGDVFVVNTGLNQLTDLEQQNGWKLLFDGKSSAGWVGAYKETFPEKGWHIKDGILMVEASDGSESMSFGDIVTVDKYRSFDLSFDFNISEGANSGVKYFVTLSEGNTGSAIGLEYQILDDERHPDAKMGRDGNRTLASLYDLKTADKQPRFVRKPGEWNQGRVIVHPDNKVEHFINGVKVLEYVRGSEDFRKLVSESKYKVWENFGEAPEGHILLQDHGDEVKFKNIKIKELN
ncbi:protein of unknown function [Belliella buryatensis]|uniref:3-keto-alpha-glucoside-1,2-lyase/3-keto-2-hydroxy-glucal hydratase domain-containing protein n=1 Tax=Belliella buryatensis TaxID=1500549 RepID=A0A239EH11_9BACT|nr:DUF1080 domain-containing protein [Belliella buryatensis]SNS43721.1 protein of unknown function [Belliella buryatensis]